MWVWALIAIAVEWIGLHAIAGAQHNAEREVVLSVEPDVEKCVDERALRARVQRWLAPGALRDVSAIAVHVATDPPAFRLRRDGQVIAERRFEASDAPCADRIDALALAIAVALEQVASAPNRVAAPAPIPTRAEGEAQRMRPNATASSAAREPGDPPEDAVQPAPAADTADGPDPVESADAPSPEAAASEPTAPSSYALHASAGGLLGVLPDPVLAAGVGVELLLAPLRLGLTALVTTESDSPLAGGQVEAQLFAARALGCLAPAATTVGFEVCGGIVAGAALARGVDFSDGRETSVGWVAPMLRAALRYPAQGPLALRLAADGMLNAVLPKFEVLRGDVGTSAGAGPVAAAASLELLVALP